jgi:hypothetical protein
MEVRTDSHTPSNIFVYQDESAQYRVWPPVFVTTENTTIVFRNLTGLDATVTLDLDPRVPGRALIVLPGDTGSLSVGATARGAYPYRVAVGPFNAVGGSDPRIIID